MTNTIVITGNSIAELEEGLAKVKELVAMGATCGVGGKSIAEIENGLKAMGVTTPIEDKCECPHCCGECYDEYEEDDNFYEDEDYEEDEDEDVTELVNEILDLADELKEKLGR